uniref:RNA helicase n=1 Tax=Catharus ustulatus TaxID=91951 RepID=A0A8C3UFW6_CATUS
GAAGAPGQPRAAPPAHVQRRSLPICGARGPLLARLRRLDTAVLIGETGSGKTTQLPQYLYEAGIGHPGVIAVTQPRRVAAVTLAARVAEEKRTELGKLVGYTVRFDDCSCAETRIRFLTDGMLLREAIGDPLLHKYRRQHPIDIFYTKERQSDYLQAALVSIFQIHQVWGSLCVPLGPRVGV